MSTKGSKYPKKKEVAKLVTENRQPCVFCNEDVDDEVIYGKLYALGDIQCHYFCVLLSCCLVQKGRDSEGLFGFVYKDIMAEVERSKKHKCSYCGRGGANLGCAVAACRKQFHLPCGRRKNAVSLFYGNYKSFCEVHAPKQKISESVMAKAKERMKRDRLIKAGKIPIIKSEASKQSESPEDPALLCVICYEDVQAFPTTQTFWPPCCGRDAWLHRACLQRMALSAGMHYLKCPLCNDKDIFYDAVCEQGYYLPDRDAAWELEQNAFAEIYNRNAECAAPECKCPFGRSHDELGMWDIKLCLLCGSWGLHALCSGGERALCAACRPAADGIEHLETRLTAVIMAEQARERRRQRSGPVMPPRMSLRRTKGDTRHSAPSSSQNLPPLESTQNDTETSPTKDRLELNLKTPRRPKLLTPHLKDIESKLLSPIKMLEQCYLEKGGGGDVVVPSELIDKIRLKFSKPRPLSAKKKIVNEILDDLFKNMFRENSKSKDPVKEWNSPRKCDITSGRNEGVKDSWDNLPKTFEKEATERAEKPEATIEEVDVNDTEEKSNKNEEKEKTCEKENHQDIDRISEEEFKIEGESSIKDGLNNLNDNGEIHDTITDVKSDDEFKIVDESIIKDGLNNLNDNGEIPDTITDVKSDDESSRSTFQLPSEFIAESEESLPILDTPKKLKMVEMKQDSSVEISENNEVLNIDVVQIGSDREKEFIKNFNLKAPVKNRVYSFKFSPLEKEPHTENVDIDVESFKDQYLNEVDRKSSVNLKNDVLRSVDVNVHVGKKRKLDMQDNGVVKKKKKNREGKKRRKLKIKIRTGDKKEKRAKKMTKMKEQLVKGVKIKLKRGKKNDKQKIKSYKQYVLKYSPLKTSNVIVKPEVDVTPIKRKYTKLEKSPDSLVQTFIHSFFKSN